MHFWAIVKMCLKGMFIYVENPLYTSNLLLDFPNLNHSLEQTETVRTYRPMLDKETATALGGQNLQLIQEHHRLAWWSYTIDIYSRYNGMK